MQRLKTLGQLFVTMLKIGLFTFGGGQAMISLFDSEFVTKKHWLDSDEFANLIAIAESTPGPIAINCATYIGYKMGKVLGAIVGTLGVVLPSFVIIFLISLFFDRFLSITWVAAAFKGIQVCVVVLILSAGVKLFKKVRKTPLNIVVMVATVGCMLAFSLLAIKFSTIFYILIAAVVGILFYSIGYIKNKRTQAIEPEDLPESEREQADSEVQS